MSFQQFKDLEGNRDLLRSLLIYRKLTLRVEKRHSYSMSKRFKDVTGIEIDHFWLIAIGLYGWCLDNGGKELTHKVISRAKDFPALSEELAARFLDLVSCDRQGYVQSLTHPSAVETGYEPYNLNPLLKWPSSRFARGLSLLRLREMSWSVQAVAFTTTSCQPTKGVSVLF